MGFIFTCLSLCSQFPLYLISSRRVGPAVCGMMHTTVRRPCALNKLTGYWHGSQPGKPASAPLLQCPVFSLLCLLERETEIGICPVSYLPRCLITWDCFFLGQNLLGCRGLDRR